MSSSKLRLIVLTDIGPYSYEPDDAESLIRLMLYSNQIDIEAIISTPSWCCRAVDEASYQRILAAVNAYGQVRDNLAVHASGYPSEEYLMNRVKHGTPYWDMASVGAGKANEGSDFIISIVDNPNDPRPVWVSAWTGLTTLAQALYDVTTTRSQPEVDAFASKLRIYDIDAQDNCGAWIMHNFPSIKFMCSDCQFWGCSSATDGNGEMVGDGSCFTDSWVHDNIQTHGPLGAAYPNRVYYFETDSPSLLYMIINGLTDPDEQSWGGWGGRFSEYKKLNPPKQDFRYQDNESYRPYYGFRDEADSYTYDGKTFTNSMFAGTGRWKHAYQHEMAVRMDWSTNSSYNACNHNPVAMLNDDATLNIVTIHAIAGQSVSLSAAGSNDPDGDALSYNWYVYSDPTTYKGTIAISNATSVDSEVVIPADATNDSIHVILEVTDNGIGFPLTSYRRAIIRLGKGGIATGTMTTVNDDDTGAADRQFEYVGNWTHNVQFRCHQDDYHSSNTPSDYFHVRFNGIQIRLYGMIANDHGTAGVQIDGGATTTVSFYGATEEGDVLLFSSRILQPGQHIMKVTVNGDGYVVPDKVNLLYVPITPTNITWSVTADMLTLSWPSNYLGWSLQVQTNSLNAGLATNWYTVPGSESVTVRNLPLDPANRAVFYRLNLSY